MVVLLGSAFALGVCLVLPELLAGVALFLGRAAGAGFFALILFNFAAAVLHSPGARLPCLVARVR